MAGHGVALGYNLSHRDRLLADISAELSKLAASRARGALMVEAVEVLFYEGEGGPVWSGNLLQALDTIANDLYWDERRSWSLADRAELRMM